MNTATMTNFDLIKLLRDKVGEEQAAALTNYVDTKVKEEVESHQELVKKNDFTELDKKVVSLDTKMTILLWMFGILIALLSVIVTVVLKGVA